MDRGEEEHEDGREKKALRDAGCLALVSCNEEIGEEQDYINS